MITAYSKSSYKLQFNKYFTDSSWAAIEKETQQQDKILALIW